MAFPVSPVLDSFNRTNEGPPPSLNWASDPWGTGVVGHQVSSNQLIPSGTPAVSAWKAARYGPDCEAAITVATLPGDGQTVTLFARMQTVGSDTHADSSGYGVRFTQVAGGGNDTLDIVRWQNGALAAVGATVVQELGAGDAIGIACNGGIIELWYKASAGAWTQLTTVASTIYPLGGYVQISTTGTAVVIDDLVGGTVGSAGFLTTTQPGASTSDTGWTVGTTVAARYSRQTYASEVAVGNFTATVQPSGVPVNNAEDCWAMSVTTKGDFSAGTWYSSASVIAVTSGGDQGGRARFRMWRSSSTTGLNAVEITESPLVGTAITNLSTSVAQSSSASIAMPGVHLENELLLLQVAWETQVAGGAADRDVLIRYGSLSQTAGSGLITSTFSALVTAGTGSGVGYLLRRRWSDAMTTMDEM